MKLQNQRVNVGVNVGVIELQIVDQRDSRAAVQKLRALVEKRAVVFVGLENKRRGRPAQARRDAEVGRDAADQKPRRFARALQNPRQRRRRRRFAVRAGDGDDGAIAHRRASDESRAGIKIAPRIENRFDQRIAARNGVAD